MKQIEFFEIISLSSIPGSVCQGSLTFINLKVAVVSAIVHTVLHSHSLVGERAYLLEYGLSALKILKCCFPEFCCLSFDHLNHSFWIRDVESVCGEVRLNWGIQPCL